MTPDELTWFEPPQVVDEAAIAAVEHAVGVRFPADYRDFARRFQGGVPLESDFPLPDPRQHTGSVGMFLSLAFDDVDSVVRAHGDLSDRLPERVIPIAVDGGGDYMCLDLRSGSGAVVYWHHERDEFTGVAPSFAAFIDMLFMPDIAAEEALD